MCVAALVTGEALREVVAKLAPGTLGCGKWQQAFGQWLPFSLGEGSLGTALTVLVVLLNCGMLVVDSVTFSVPCLPVFLYLLHLPLCQNAAIAKKKKKEQRKTFAFQLSLPLIICNCCVLDYFFFNIIYSTLYGLNVLLMQMLFFCLF